MCGGRSRATVAALEKCAIDKGTEISIFRLENAPARIRLETTDLDVAVQVAAMVTEITQKKVLVHDSAANSIAAELPSFSEVLEVLPRTTAISGRRIERWDVHTARFFSASDATSPGAYRISNFVRSYVFRRSSDIGSLSALLGDARLVKYAAALDARTALIGYDREAEVLYTPLGADLPGLYGRSACLATGKPPKPNLEEHLLEYHGVNPQLASRLMSLLSA